MILGVSGRGEGYGDLLYLESLGFSGSGSARGRPREVARSPEPWRRRPVEPRTVRLHDHTDLAELGVIETVH